MYAIKRPASEVNPNTSLESPGVLSATHLEPILPKSFVLATMLRLSPEAPLVHPEDAPGSLGVGWFRMFWASTRSCTDLLSPIRKVLLIAVSNNQSPTPSIVVTPRLPRSP